MPSYTACLHYTCYLVITTQTWSWFQTTNLSYSKIKSRNNVRTEHCHSLLFSSTRHHLPVDFATKSDRKMRRSMKNDKWGQSCDPQISLFHKIDGILPDVLVKRGRTAPFACKIIKLKLLVPNRDQLTLHTNVRNIDSIRNHMCRGAKKINIWALVYSKISLKKSLNQTCF